MYRIHAVIINLYSEMFYGESKRCSDMFATHVSAPSADVSALIAKFVISTYNSFFAVKPAPRFAKKYVVPHYQENRSIYLGRFDLPIFDCRSYICSVDA